MPPSDRVPHVAVVADSSACLPAELFERHHIIIVPLAFLVDGELYRDGQLSGADFYSRLEGARRFPTTTSPAPGEFLQAFRSAAGAGATSVLCLTLSSRYSGTHSAAVTAAQLAGRELPALRVEVVDTGGLAMSHGFAVLEAARATETGATVDQAADLAREVGRRGRLVGVLDTMRFLAKSGRVPFVVHLAASLLGIKPVLAFESGRPRSVARARTRQRAIEAMLSYVEDAAGDWTSLHMAVMHAEAPVPAVQLAERAKEKFEPAELLVTPFTAVMGVHTGPGFLGLAFYSDAGLPRFGPAGRETRHLLERDVKVLEGALGRLPQAVGTPELVLLSGLPGTGKSSLARALVQRRPMAVLESDRMRRALFKEPTHTQAESLRLFAAMNELLDRLLAGGLRVVYDATNLKESHRRAVYETAERRGARLVVVSVEAPRRIVRKRLGGRGTGRDLSEQSTAGRDIYERMRSEVEPIQRPHIVVDTTEDISEAVDTIMRQLEDARA